MVSLSFAISAQFLAKINIFKNTSRELITHSMSWVLKPEELGNYSGHNEEFFTTPPFAGSKGQMLLV